MRASGRTSVEGLDGSEQGANQPVPVSWLKLGPEPGRLAEHRLQIKRIGKEKAGGPGGDGGGGKGLSTVQAENPGGGLAVLPASFRRLRRLIRSLIHDRSNKNKNKVIWDAFF